MLQTLLQKKGILSVLASLFDHNYLQSTLFNFHCHLLLPSQLQGERRHLSV